MELVVDLVIYIPWDLVFWFWAKKKDSNEGVKILSDRTLTYLVTIVTGAALGGLSLLLWRQTFLRYSWMRVANLLLAPLVAGAFSWFIARRGEARRGHASPRRHFVLAWCFMLALVIVRFIYARRPH